MKAGRKEQLSIVLSGNQSPRDAVAAVGLAQMFAHHVRQTEDANKAARKARCVSMGMTTLALKNGNRSRLWKEAVTEIAATLAWRGRAKAGAMADTIARAALQEHIIDICPACQGKKETPDHDVPNLLGVQPMKSCRTCIGTGLRTYTNEERVIALNGQVDARHCRDKINEALALIRECEKLAVEHWVKVLG